METSKGKEVINPQQSNSTEDRNNSVQRPYKIQKLDISAMATSRYQDPGASTSGDQPSKTEHFYQYSAENTRTQQENYNQEASEPNMDNEDPFFMYEDEVIGEGIK